MILPRIVRSGATPNCSWAPPRATRKPEITSSKMSSAPVASARSRSSARKPGSGGTRPMLAGTGSARIAANRWRSVAATSAWASFQGTITVAAATAAGTPGLAGMPLRRPPRAGLRQQPVDVTVVGAGELEHRLAAGDRAGQADRAHRGLGARGGHAQHFDRGHPPGDLGGQLDLAFGRRAERGAAPRRLDH